MMIVRIKPFEAQRVCCNIRNREGRYYEGRYYAYKDGADDDVKGIVCVVFRSWFLSEIRHLYVLPEFRQQGIGTALVRKAVELVKTPLACSTVREDNIHSLKIFKRLGFVEVRAFTNPDTGNRIVLMLK